MSTRDTIATPHLSCSYVEVYNEELSDLLASGTSGGGGALSVREGDKRGVYVEGLTEHVAVNGGCRQGGQQLGFRTAV